jgi:hypothetical protein
MIILRAPSDGIFTVSPPTNTISSVGGDQVATFLVSGTLTI